MKNCKIPNINPELIELRKHFLVGLFLGGVYIREAYIRKDFWVKRWLVYARKFLHLVSSQRD